MFQKFSWGRFHTLPGWCYSSLEIFSLSFLLELSVLSTPDTAIFASSFITSSYKAVGVLPYPLSYFSFWMFLLGFLHTLSKLISILCFEKSTTLNAKYSKSIIGSVLKALLSFTESIIVFALSKSVVLSSHIKFKNCFSRKFFSSGLSSICKFPNPYFYTSLFWLKSSFLASLYYFFFLSPA